MGRPTIGKRAMTAAERQTRRRKRLGREKAKAERQAKLETNRAKKAARATRNTDQTWTTLYWPPAPPLADPADELVDQIYEAIQLTPEITLADIQAAIERRLLQAALRK